MSYKTLKNMYIAIICGLMISGTVVGTGLYLNECFDPTRIEAQYQGYNMQCTNSGDYVIVEKGE